MLALLTPYNYSMSRVIAAAFAFHYKLCAFDFRVVPKSTSVMDLAPNEL